MNQSTIQRLIKTITGRSPREQTLLILAAAAVLYALVDILVFGAQTKQMASLDQKIKAQQAQILSLQQQAQQFNDPAFKPAPIKNETNELLQQLATIEVVERAITAGPPKLDALFEDLRAKQHPKIQIQRIKTTPSRAIQTAPSVSTKAVAKKDAPAPAQLPTTPLTGSGAATPSAAATSGTPIYRHGIELEVRGAYLDLLAYLKTLENRHPLLFWSDITLSAQTYPENNLRVTLYLLSRQPGLGI